MKKRVIFAFLFALIFTFPAFTYSSSDSDISIGAVAGVVALIFAILFYIAYTDLRETKKSREKEYQRNQALIDQINHLKTQMQDIDEQKLKSSISALNKKISELTQQLLKKENVHAQLQREYSQLLTSSQDQEKRLNTVKNNLSAASNREAKAHKEILILNQEIDALRKERARTSTKLQVLKKERDDLKSVLAHREHEFSQLQQAYDILRASLRPLDSAEYKMLKPYLSTEEYQKLPQAQMHSLALERYQKRHRTEWEVGLGFERLIGYRYEKKGYHVEYVGATSGKEDMGRDLIVSNKTEVFIVQCKRWSRGSQIHEKHIFQLQGTLTLYQKQHPDIIAIGVFITTAMLSPKAKETALSLGIETIENFSYAAHPMIKCKAGTGQYYLPMDSDYDKISISFASGDYYHKTVEAAISAGFQSAYQ